VIQEGTRGQGLKDSSEMLKNVKGADKVFRKQTLESLPAVSVAGLTPGILGPSSPTKVEKIQKLGGVASTRLPST